MSRARRKLLWVNLVLLFFLNTILYYLLGSWGNKWLGILSGVGIIIMCLIDLFVPESDSPTT